MEAYADDTTLYSLVTSQQTPTVAAQSLQVSVDRLHEWGRTWKVMFEPTKSQALTATLRRTGLDLPPLLFGGTLVPETTTITLLGVKVDAKLTFSDHLRSVATRARQRLGVLNRAAHILTPAGRTTVYKAFV